MKFRMTTRLTTRMTENNKNNSAWHDKSHHDINDTTSGRNEDVTNETQMTTRITTRMIENDKSYSACHDITRTTPMTQHDRKITRVTLHVMTSLTMT